MLAFLKHQVHEVILSTHTLLKPSKLFTILSHSYQSQPSCPQLPHKNSLLQSYHTHFSVPSLQIYYAAYFFLAYFPPPTLIPMDSFTVQFSLPSITSSVGLISLSLLFFLNSYNFIIWGIFFSPTQISCLMI